MNHVDLITYLETLIEPAQEADAEICVFLGNIPDFDPSIFVIPVRYKVSDDGLHAEAYVECDGKPWCAVSREPPKYTKSIDAAMTAVPATDKKGRSLWIRLNQFAGGHGSGRSAWFAELFGTENEQTFKCEGVHEFPAVALMIAILRTKQAL